MSSWHRGLLALLGIVVSSVSVQGKERLARKVLPNGDIMLPGMILTLPTGWTLAQDAISGETLILGFANGDDYLTLYVTQNTGLVMKNIFVNGSQVDKAATAEQHGPFDWSMLSTSKTNKGLSASNVHVRAFFLERDQVSYYGFARSTSATTAAKEAEDFLDGVRAQVRQDRSLTGDDYSGKKFYFGFGDRLSGEMGNEVKYDVSHTHDIFTTQIGGTYASTVQVGTNHDKITSAWSDIRSKMTDQDMYVEYSSGHGSQEGLMAGVDYSEIRDAALAMPAKEIIIFIMSCYSGNLLDSFNEQKSVWKDWQSQGRTLMVMSSSKDDEESDTGPGTDDDEPNGPDGSAGSAFGHALWKSLIGYADGYVDGVKDGFVSLGEIQAYAYDLTVKITSSDQHPAVTGTFNPNLIMNRVPSAKELSRLVPGSTEGMSDAQIQVLVQKLDSLMRVK